ncbi:hypothetical protein [Bacillus spizizenii]|uniref:hypothetical protein n=1 Tax=Bacillus spizizenii TaxID=96241 RepID=UPI0008692BEB|nr:hypothetical protein [Bacillus spizizenii]MED0870625.1 hypothetical protein [Bacillus spizizenii]MED1070786.1 hypothetical protein [Bacillus spizizenii]SCV41383.1 Uncharacterized protein yoaW [Bacillus subtilis]
MEIKILGLTAVLMCFFGIGSTHVSALDFDHKTDFILNDSTKSFVLEIISDVPAIDYILGYQFTILGANTCSVEIKLQRMGLTGEYTTLSTKQFSGSWFDFSAQDKVSIDPFHRYRILAEEHSENCTSVRVKGSYGIQYFHFD